MRLTILAAALAAATALAAPRPVRVVLAGDSTVTDQAGWGKGFKAALTSDAECVNLARGGASTLSFRTAGEWAKVLASEADWVLIQFGHNDVPGKGPTRETDAATTFRENLARFIKEVRDAGMRPVLVTSVTHRRFDSDGKFVPDKTLAPYAEASRAVAAEQKVPLIDLYAATAAQCERLGQEACEALGPMAKDKDGVERRDGTHYAAKGAEEVGAMAAREFARVAPEAARLVRGAN
jgi:lysophospholipase L1-like esterase